MRSNILRLELEGRLIGRGGGREISAPLQHRAQVVVRLRTIRL